LPADLVSQPDRRARENNNIYSAARGRLECHGETGHHRLSEEGYSATNEIRDFETTIDANGEDAPDTLEALLAAYGSCYVPALRVGGQQRRADDLGRIEIETSGELNDDDKLESIQFDISVEADIDDDTGEEIIERAFELCKVHDALKESLHADTSFEGRVLKSAVTPSIHSTRRMRSECHAMRETHTVGP